MSITELKEKTLAELKKELSELYREQFNLRMQQGDAAEGNAVRPHQFKVVRKKIAQVKTLMTQHEQRGQAE